MSLFQNSVEQKYLNQLDGKLVDAKYAEFKAYFGNPEIEKLFLTKYICQL